MPNQSTADLGSYMWRGGERIPLIELPDRFTARLKSGVEPETVADHYPTRHERKLRRQALDEFSVVPEYRDAVMERVREGNDVQFASHVYAPEDEPNAELYLTDEITVQFKPEVSEEDIEKIASESGLILDKELQTGRTYVFKVGPRAKENPIKITNRLMEDDRVLLSEPNVAVSVENYYVPNDTLFPNQWHLHNNGGPFLSAEAHVDAVRAWDITRGERAVIVAVADDSCDISHTDFSSPGKIVSPRDFSDHDFLPLPESPEDNHGTACSGVAVAEENGTGVVGAAPGCSLMPIRTSGFIDDRSIEDLCDWVIAHNASVLSCSWGVAARHFPLNLRMREALHRAATIGRGGKGCVVVFASGNSNRPVDGTVNETGWPHNNPSGPTRWLAGFAAHEDVIAVSASSSVASKSLYSNWGDEISVCAPSNNVPPSTFPRVNTTPPGRGIVTTDRIGPSGYSSTDYTNGFGGTSSACPLVAGVAALIISANPELSARSVREILETTADKIIDSSLDPQLGNQFGTYNSAGHSKWFGYGKVNAFQAVVEAKHRLDGQAGESLRGTSSPNLAIPDSEPEGVSDAIQVDEDARVSNVEVVVNIHHTYIGDLRLTLISPSGTMVLLHDRNGGAADNLQRQFDASNTPGLSELAGEFTQGEWTLWVQDMATADTGVLSQWEITVNTQSASTIEVEESPGMRIPDNDPTGIERTLEVAEIGDIKSLEVSIDITHSYVGDLIIKLTSPAGHEVVLQERVGGSQDNLIHRFAFANTSELQTFFGQPTQGQWKLKVVDLAGLDVGKLNQWGLKFSV